MNGTQGTLVDMVAAALGITRERSAAHWSAIGGGSGAAPTSRDAAALLLALAATERPEMAAAALAEINDMQGDDDLAALVSEGEASDGEVPEREWLVMAEVGDNPLLALARIIDAARAGHPGARQFGPVRVCSAVGVRWVEIMTPRPGGANIETRPNDSDARTSRVPRILIDADDVGTGVIYAAGGPDGAIPPWTWPAAFEEFREIGQEAIAALARAEWGQPAPAGDWPRVHVEQPGDPGEDSGASR